MKVSTIASLLLLPGFDAAKFDGEPSRRNNVFSHPHGGPPGQSPNGPPGQSDCNGNQFGNPLPKKAWRSFDGSDRGDGAAEAETLLMRMGDMSYQDPDGEMMMDGPNPRTISNIVSRQGALNGNSKGLSDIFWQWGQFLDHDIDLTDFSDAYGTADVEITDPNDPFAQNCAWMRFDRSEYVGLPRQQVNRISGYIDASNVYGSDEHTAARLRTFEDGKMATSQDGQMLPENPEADDGSYLAGDVRANEHIGLTSMHALFVREHNRLAAEIKERFFNANDDEIYQLARKLVGAEIQIITFREFLPLLLGDAAPGEHGEFSMGVDPSIANEFSTVAYRVGHSMLSPEFEFRDANGGDPLGGNRRLRDMFFNPGFFQNAAERVDFTLGGQMQKECQEIDHQIIDDVRDFLFDDGCLDLGALNIQRGRDHGLMTYNGIREAMHLPKAESFADITPDGDLQAKLALAYDGDVDQVDAWIGGLCEPHVDNGAVVGELFQTILVDQFTRLRDGDMFWFTNDDDVFDCRLSGFWNPDHVSLDMVIQKNTVHTSATNVFFAS